MNPPLIQSIYAFCAGVFLRLSLPVFLFVPVPASGTELALPGFFSDGMVVQREMPVRVWGWAEPGAEVSVTFRGATAETRATASGWEVKFPAGPAGGPFVLRVRSSGEELVVEDVYVGEVIVLAGQSNARWPIARTDSAAAKIAMARADRPLIRQFDHRYRAASEPLDDVKDGRWLKADAERIGLLSLVGFFTARSLRDEVGDIPVGLIEVAVGGTRIRSWISREKMKSDPRVAPLLENYLSAIPLERKRHAIGLSGWEQKAAAARAAGEPVPRKPNEIRFGPRDENHPHRPSGYYYARVAPFAGLPVRAVVWYQGESDAVDAVGDIERQAHGHHLTALIEDWRSAWRRPELPFLIVQLPSFGSDQHDFVTIRRGQQEAAKASPGTGLVVTIDTGDIENIHPFDKEPVGQRLAAMLAKLIRKEDWVVQGPEFAGVSFDGDRYILEFDLAPGRVLRNGSSGTPPLLELIRGATQPELEWTGFRWVDPASGEAADAKARIIAPNKIAVPPPPEARFRELHYLQENFAKPDVSVYDSAGFPAAPFRVETAAANQGGKSVGKTPSRVAFASSSTAPTGFTETSFADDFERPANIRLMPGADAAEADWKVSESEWIIGDHQDGTLAVFEPSEANQIAWVPKIELPSREGSSATVSGDVLVTGKWTWAGIAFGIESPERYYQLRIKGETADYQVLRIEDGDIQVIVRGRANAMEPFALGTFYNLEVSYRIEGGVARFVFAIREKGEEDVLNPVYEFNLTDFPDGYAGFVYANAGRTYVFDDFQVEVVRP